MEKLRESGPRVYFGREFDLAPKHREDLTRLIRSDVDWQGPDHQSVNWNGFLVEFWLAVRPNGDHPGWLTVHLFTCKKTGIYHRSSKHVFCGERCSRLDAENTP